MRIFKKRTNSHSCLVGVPKRNVPDLWWRVFYWPGALGKRGVPEPFRSEGVCCPECRTIQPLFEQCLNCGSAFSCFVVVKAYAGSSSPRLSAGEVPEAVAKLGQFDGLLSRFGRATLLKRVIACCTLLLLTALVAGIVWHRNHQRRQYAQNYVQALYGIKSGLNMVERVCDGTYNAWRGLESSTASVAGGIEPQALSDLNAINANLNKVMGKMKAPPEECAQSALILERLFNTYAKMNSLISRSTGSISRHETEISAAKRDFTREIGNLKANLPAPIADELRIASRKYDLRFMALGK